MEMALHKVVYGEEDYLYEKVSVRIINFDSSLSLRKLKANYIGKFIQISGNVVKVSNITPTVTDMTFTCQKCSNHQRRYFKDGTFTIPTTCKMPSCKSKSHLHDTTKASTIDWQKIKIQEILSDSSNEAGRIPKTIEVELTRDLVDKCIPGDHITICGIVKVLNSEQGTRRSKGAQQLFILYLEGNSIVNSRLTNDNQDDSTEFSTKDLQMIREIYQEKELFHLITNSLCPAIYGNEVVKAGLILSLFGGCQKYTSEKNKLTVRGDSHCLIVGDPGLGKSQLLTATSRVSPRGVYVCGNTTSTSGLTVTVVRDSSGDYSLEAGALVLSDQGICCIDEFDKMKNEHQALLEAMEQQSISIAKAGMVCTLPARCCVIAAANPVGGHYNKAKTVSENLKINSALLSRFDLLFILLDKPDEKRDQLLSEHVMRLHAGVEKKKNKDPTQIMMTQSKRKPLKDKLKPDYVKNFEPLPASILRKYIAYARKYVNPKLSLEACDVLQEFYIGLRKIQHSSDSIPITTRQLESLIRLAQARAKLELREIVTEQDALDVVEIMKESLYDILTDEKGQIDFRRNSGSTKSKDSNQFLSELNRFAIKKGSSIFSVQEMYTISKDCNLRTKNFDRLIEQLNHEGYLLKQSGNNYKLAFSDLK